jgi:hypothetical protein
MIVIIMMAVIMMVAPPAPLIAFRARAMLSLHHSEMHPMRMQMREQDRQAMLLLVVQGSVKRRRGICEFLQRFATR